MAIMAVDDINNNPDILPDHKLMLDIQNGQCEADVVMKKFIDFIKNKDPTKFRSMVGILGKNLSYICIIRIVARQIHKRRTLVLISVLFMGGGSLGGIKLIVSPVLYVRNENPFYLLDKQRRQG